MRTILLAASAALAAAQSFRPFGTGLSQGSITQEEKSIFSYTLSENATHGTLAHTWITGGGSIDFAIISIYIDGESAPSIQYSPPMASGTGFRDETAPWGTEWFGKGAASGGWYNNFRVPFQRSINITYKAGPGQPNDVIYMIVRGAENLPITIGGVDVPAAAARLLLQVQNVTLQPLQYLNVVDVPTGSGLVFMQTLAFSAGNLNTLEGCHHFYSPYNTSYPGLQISTGTEDYFISAYYFNAGAFRLPNSGMTHYSSSNGTVELSAYRFHTADVLAFTGGARLVWRNGDATDPATGLKCTLETGGNTVGSPTAAQVLTYGWVYVW